MDQLRLEGMPKRLFACTPSKLASFADCPRRYRMTYLDRPAPPKGAPWAHNAVGASVHNALRAWWDQPPSRRTPVRAGALVQLGWIDEGFRDPEQSARWRVRAREMVERYAGTLDPGAVPRAVERQVGARTERLALSGRIDRLDQRGDELVVVDYKTGRRVPGEDDARGSMALALYAVGAGRTMRMPCTRVELHHVPTGRIAAWEHSAEGLARQVGRAEAIAADVEVAAERLAAGATADEAFPPAPGRLCSWCDYRRHCPEGQRAGDARRSWDGLAEPGEDQPEDLAAALPPPVGEPVGGDISGRMSP